MGFRGHHGGDSLPPQSLRDGQPPPQPRVNPAPGRRGLGEELRDVAAALLRGSLGPPLQALLAEAAPDLGGELQLRLVLLEGRALAATDVM